jgi:hypothetical protein
MFGKGDRSEILILSKQRWMILEENGSINQQKMLENRD